MLALTTPALGTAGASAVVLPTAAQAPERSGQLGFLNRPWGFSTMRPRKGWGPEWGAGGSIFLPTWGLRVSSPT